MGDIKILLEILIEKPKNLISIARDRWRFIVLLTISTTVVLSTWIGVGGCRCPNYWSVIPNTFVSRSLRKRSPSCAYAAEAATSLRIAHVM